MTRDPLKHLAWFLSLPEPIRAGINERRLKAGMEPHGVPGGMPAADGGVPPGPPVSPPDPPPPSPIVPVDPVAAWNRLIGEYRAVKKAADDTLAALGRGAEFDACMDAIQAIKAQGAALRAAVEKHLGRALTDGERVEGIHAQ